MATSFNLRTALNAIEQNDPDLVPDEVVQQVSQYDPPGGGSPLVYMATMDTVHCPVAAHQAHLVGDNQTKIYIMPTVKMIKTFYYKVVDGAQKQHEASQDFPKNWLHRTLSKDFFMYPKAYGSGPLTPHSAWKSWLTLVWRKVTGEDKPEKQTQKVRRRNQEPKATGSATASRGNRSKKSAATVTDAEQGPTKQKGRKAVQADPSEIQVWKDFRAGELDFEENDYDDVRDAYASIYGHSAPKKKILEAALAEMSASGGKIVQITSTRAWANWQQQESGEDPYGLPEAPAGQPPSNGADPDIDTDTENQLATEDDQAGVVAETDEEHDWMSVEMSEDEAYEIVSKVQKRQAIDDIDQRRVKKAKYMIEKKNKVDSSSDSD